MTQTNQHECSECGTITEDIQLIDNQYLCNDCMQTHYTTCDDCNSIIPIDEAYTTHDGRTICDDCSSDHYFTCDYCNTLHHIDEPYIVTHDDQYICDDCSCHYIYCNDCGQYYHEDDMNYCERDDEYYCNNCYDNHIYDNIYGYHDFSDWEYYTTDNPPTYTPQLSTNYLGAEIEIYNSTNQYSNNDTAGYVNSHIPAVCMEDGSIGNGYEIITHPQTFEYYVSRYEDYSNTFRYLRDCGYVGDDSTTCGLHIHISSAHLQDDTIDKIYLFMENYKDRLINFSRRHSTRWAKFLSDAKRNDESDDIIKSIDYIKKEKCNHDRYMALNIQHSSRTIEFRLFKSTLNIETFYATLQLVKSIVEVCDSTPIEEITWDKVINYIDEPYLKSYLNRRNITSTSQPIVNNTELYYNEYIKPKEELLNKSNELILKIHRAIKKVINRANNEKYARYYSISAHLMTLCEDYLQPMQIRPDAYSKEDIKYRLKYVNDDIQNMIRNTESLDKLNKVLKELI